MTRLNLMLQLHLQVLICQALLWMLIGYAGWASAETPIKLSTDTHPTLSISAYQGQGLHLEVLQMPLTQVLDALADKTHIPIHYSALPEDRVTIKCRGATFKEALECILDRKADLIVRYHQSTNPSTSKFPIAEIWIIGSRKTLAKDIPVSTNKNREDKNPESGRVDQLLEMSKSQNPQDRADAIGSLLGESHTDNIAVKTAIEQALSDEDANVRAQAISSYTHQESSAAVTQAIREAMNDSSADVRIMAVDSITNDTELLQQAVNDSDETIRNLAKIKLEALVSENGN